MYEKIKVWYKSQDKVKIMLIMIVIAFLVLELTPSFKSQVDTAIQETKIIEKLEPKVIEIKVDEKLEEIEKAADKKAEECQIVDGNIVLSENEFLKGRNLAIFDLNTFEYNENKYHLTTSRDTGAEIFGVRLKKINRDGTQTYITHYELVSNLQLNKKEYERYLLIKGKK